MTRKVHTCRATRMFLVPRVTIHVCILTKRHEGKHSDGNVSWAEEQETTDA